MNFSWRRFCSDNHIEFVTEGPSTAPGNIYVRCPWCADDKLYMGLSLNTRQPYFACWKSGEHRGKNPTRLVSILLGISFNEAQQIVDAEDSSALDDYEAAVARVLSPSSNYIRSEKPRTLVMPKTFRPLYEEGPGRQRFLDYLEGRGFPAPQAVAARYRLHYCRVGSFQQRVVIPIYRDGKLQTWTARDVTGLSKLRYKTLSDKPELAQREGCDPALVPINDTVFNYDKAARGGIGLVINEGPFDAIKVDWYAPMGYAAVALYGMPKNAQMAVLVRLASGFKRVFVTLDAAATSNGRKLWAQLEPVLGPKVRQFTLERDDPGSLTGRQVRELLGRW